MTKRLTRKALYALGWIADREPVGVFPLADDTPSIPMINKLRKLGLIEEAGPRQGFRTIRYQVSEKGRVELADAVKVRVPS